MIAFAVTAALSCPARRHTCFSDSCPSSSPLAAPAHSAPRDTTLGCTGPFARDATHDGAVKAFSKGNVKTESVGVGEGEMARATVIFPRDKTRRVVSEIRTSTGSRWRTPQGVTAGMPLADIEKINGRPFTLAGFGWDYGGTTTDWQGGALATQDGGCRLMLRFDQTQATNADIDGDRDIASDDKGMRSAAPVVEEISLRFE